MSSYESQERSLLRNGNGFSTTYGATRRASEGAVEMNQSSQNASIQASQGTSIQPSPTTNNTDSNKIINGVRRFSASSAASTDFEEMPRGREKRSGTVDEFNIEEVRPEVKMINIAKTLRTGRQRKKTAARTKGGEFQARRKKRRVYFCCISNDIDVEKLADEFQQPHFGMKGQMYDEVLHLFLAKSGDTTPIDVTDKQNILEGADLIHLDSGMSSESGIANPLILDSSQQEQLQHEFGVRQPTQLDLIRPPSPFEVSYKEETLSHNRYDHTDNEQGAYLSTYEEEGYPSANEGELSPNHRGDTENILNTSVIPLITTNHPKSTTYIAETEHSKEVFVFGFGVAVFWGLAKSEVQDILQFIERFIVKDRLSTEEFAAGEDDIAFVTDYEAPSVIITNDVITLPAITTVKERLALSFAIAQSAVLTIFEARVEKKIEEYKYIPEVLAESGKVHLSPKQLGVMIGQVFVMQHDVNLHSEILDLPDYFWKEHHVEPIYRMTMSYMEMEQRITVLNKRLDLMGQLLKVLQQQHENAHSVKLEWIVIWLIVASCVLELWDIVKDVFGIEFNSAPSVP